MKKIRKILLIDNYDSFTYSLIEQLRNLDGVSYKIIKNDKINLENIKLFDKILLSPGPGIPYNAGQLKEVIREYASAKSILGICLGHQAIGEVFGAKLKNLSKVFHGTNENILLKNSNEYLFKGFANSFKAGLYHSWVIDRDSFPECLKITATAKGGRIMAISHRQYDVKGIQFHPESYLTQAGRTIIFNWVNQ
jgi:anthranilate synthase component II